MKYKVEYRPRSSKDRKPYVCFLGSNCFNPLRKSSKGLVKALQGDNLYELDETSRRRLEQYEKGRNQVDLLKSVFEF